MKQLTIYSDQRLEGRCVYCGGSPETRDHVPSKVLLESPFPENLPIVSCCNKCNQGFSKDEEYLSCLLECTLRGTTDPEKLERQKVRAIFERTPKLRARLTEAMEQHDGQVYFRPEKNRIKNVILKLARGHATYENSELQLEEPISIMYKPILLMTKEEQTEFYSNYSELWPEVGSRAFQRFFIDDDTVVDNWIIVQDDTYSYSFNHRKYGLTVKILIWNYLACEVIWN